MTTITTTTTATASSLQSFTPGPRPLHLALSIPSPASSSGASNYISFSPYPESPHNSVPLAARISRSASTSRRQSSISYFSPTDSEAGNSTIRTPARHGSTKSMSVGLKSSFSPGIAGDRRSTGSVGSTQSERPPHTLAEKHADLLHFIAQKESKCLELRSQLAIHETELLQLKRKWERIVNRGFERSNGIPNDYPPSSYSPVNSNAQMQGGNGAMLDGLREGVQGVSRLIAAGLEELSSSTVSLPSSVPSPRFSGTPRQSHSTQTSSSSVSTYTTTTSESTRLSQSSASSVGDDSCELPAHEKMEGEAEGKIEQERKVEAETVSVVGARFAMSHEFDSGVESRSDDNKSKRPSVTAATDKASTKKTHRRMSRNTSSPQSPSTSPFTSFSSRSIDLSTTPVCESPSPSTSFKKTLKAKRMSGTGLPAVASSMAELGSLAAAGGSAGVSPGVSSWVGSVGKRWEEIQRGSTFTKSQKRASILFSDMSQSIASALSSGSPPTASYNPTTVLRAQPPSSGSCSGTGSGATSQSTTPLQTSSSLLDEDDEDNDTTVHTGKLGAVMQPDSSASLLHPTPQTNMNVNMSVKDTRGGVGSRGVVQMLDDDEEWGW